MNWDEVIFTRKSIRSFDSKDVPANIVEKILESGRCAPSAQNRQCWRFLVINDRELIQKIAFHSFIGTVNFFIKDAPLLIIACALPKESIQMNQQDYYLVDTAIAFHQMILTAWANGIGSCWMAAFNENKLKKVLAIPDSVRIVALSPFGYPKDKEDLFSKAVKLFAGSTSRKPLEHITYYNNWNKKGD